MIIDKEIISQIYRPYFFISGIFDIDQKYFKKKIEEGIQNSNLNYKTNVCGYHTDWKFFNEDKNFNILLMQIIDYLEKLDIDLEKFYLEDSWGIVLRLGDYTKKHHHNNFYLSGVLYLNDHPQKLYFPEINQEIIPQKGRWVLFSSYLLHYTNRNIQEIKKYAISFNFHATPFNIENKK
jgi:hypothetical protein|tara:strand:- start:49 stop:585 length:537 start_codon:yes stop_codon:yes gene_type:complete